MPPKKTKTETGVGTPSGELWTPAMLSTFLAQQAARPQKDFRKTAFFDLLNADALALLQAFLETKSIPARAFYYQQPWPGRDLKTLVPGSTQWKDRVREYLLQANLYAVQHAAAKSVSGPISRANPALQEYPTYSATAPVSTSELSNSGNGPAGRGGQNPRAYHQGASSYPGQPDPVGDAMNAAIAANARADQRAGHFGE